MVVSPSQNISLVTGRRAEIVCKSEGSPEPQVQWIDRGVGRLLVLDPVKLEDAGIYTCHAWNSVGDHWRNITVTVECMLD